MRCPMLLLSAGLCSLGLLFSQEAIAQPVTLNRAVVQFLRNQVRLIPQNQSPRLARVSDAMAPGDALATAIAAMAELRFNDGSLARVGEQAVFRFVAKTRTFQLSNGTVLLLIPPGRGGTRVRTPNATAGIKGSALFVRYIAPTDTTLLGALTDNPQCPIVITNRDGSQQQEVRSGELAVVVKDRIERIYKMDLSEFYQTSELVKGLQLDQPPTQAESDNAIAQVRAETVAALKAQSPLMGERVITNPEFVQLSGRSSNFPSANRPSATNSSSSNTPARNGLATVLENNQTLLENLPVDSILNAGEVQANPSTLVNPIADTPVNGSTTILPIINSAGTVLPGVGNTGGVPPVGGSTSSPVPIVENPTVIVPPPTNTGGVFPGGGNTGGVFPGGGNTGGVFPGGGNTGGSVPIVENPTVIVPPPSNTGGTGGVFPGGGNTGGVFPGGGNTGGVFPGGGN